MIVSNNINMATTPNKNKKGTKKLDTSFYKLSSFKSHAQTYVPPPLNPPPYYMSTNNLNHSNLSFNNLMINNVSMNHVNVDISSNNTDTTSYETGFNFYEELQKDDEDDETTDKCLISNLPLDKTKIEFSCGHKFNYYYIFKEIVNSKKINHNVIPSEKLERGKIKCPYCRTIYNNLLPPSFDIPDTQTLPFINSPYKLCMPIKCNETNCSKKTYVTPLGYYCKPHYTYIKSGGTIQVSFEENENDIEDEIESEIDYKPNVKLSGPENLHPQWKLYTHYKVIELKDILRNKGMKVSGTKPVLISRLLNNNIPLLSLALNVNSMNQIIQNYPWHISM